MNIKTIKNLSPDLHGQRGAATLFVVVIVLLLVTLITYTMTNTTVLEGRMTTSDVKSRQAFHAAQAGLDFALQNILTNDLAILSTSCDEQAVDEGNPDSPTFQLRFGTELECPAPLIGLQTRSIIRAIGRSSDGSAVRMLEVAIDLEREWLGADPVSPWGSGPPPQVPAALYSRGGISLSGNASAAPCATIDACQGYATQGAQNVDISTHDGFLAIAGGSFDMKGGGKPETRLVEDQTLQSGRSDLNDMSPEEFFVHVMGTEKSTYKEGSKVITPDPKDKKGETIAAELSSVNLNPAVWINGDLVLTGGGTYGSPDKPITLVVDGNLTMSGGVIVWGVVYVTGTQIDMRGNSKILGALIGEEFIDDRGTVEVFHNSELATVATPGGTIDEDVSLGGVQANFDARSWREVFF